MVVRKSHSVSASMSLSFFDVIVSEIALVCLFFCRNSNQSSSRIFEEQIFAVILGGVEELELAWVSLIDTIHFTHVSQNRNDCGDFGVAFSCHHRMGRIDSSVTSRVFANL